MQEYQGNRHKDQGDEMMGQFYVEQLNDGFVVTQTWKYSGDRKTACKTITEVTNLLMKHFG